MAFARPIERALAELIADRLRVLGQPVRIRLIDYLRRHDAASVQTLADETGISLHNASQHLGLLREAGVVRRRQEGRTASHELVDQSALVVYRLIASSMSDRYRRLGRELGQ